jgi:formylglycine-generating enzyme required for sulfatase activity
LEFLVVAQAPPLVVERFAVFKCFICEHILARARKMSWLALLAPLALLGAAASMDATNQPAGAAACAGVEIKSNGVSRCVSPAATFKDCDDCPEMVVLPPGDFQMGSPDDEAGHTSEEAPVRAARIGYFLAVAKFEATFAEWDACVADGGCKHQPRDSGWGRGRQPVINVSWDDITSQYLPWLSHRTGQTYRLLTETEWEYAARAGTAGPFSTGSTISTQIANYDGTSTYTDSPKGEYRKRSLAVGSFPANPFGLHDVHGNVWEWVQDCHAKSYAGLPADGSPAPEVPGCQRVMRGGSWIDSPRVLRSAARGRVPANTRFIYRGFRVARTT